MKLFLAKLTNEDKLSKDVELIGVVAKNKMEVHEHIKKTYDKLDYNIKVEINEISNIGNYEIIVKEKVKI